MKPCQENGIWREENVKRRRSQEKRCQHIRMPRERGINGKRLKSHRFQETAMTYRKYVSVLALHNCQQEGLSRFRDDKGKPDQEKVASQEKDVESKKRQGERVPRADRVNGRDKQAVRCRSLRLFILFLGSSPFETSVARALLALFCV